jgi:hypothetical protein
MKARLLGITTVRFASSIILIVMPPSKITLSGGRPRCQQREHPDHEPEFEYQRGDQSENQQNQQ